MSAVQSLLHSVLPKQPSAEQGTIGCVAITQYEFRHIIQTNCFEYLPSSRNSLRMLCRIDVKYPPAIMAEDHQNKQHTKRRSWDRKRINGNNICGVIRQEGTPQLRRWSPVSDHVLGYRSFGYTEAELQEFAMDSRCSLQRICERHPLHQRPYFNIDRRPPFFSRLTSPILPKSFPMPTDYSVGFDEMQCISPFRPDSGYKNPELSVRPRNGCSRAVPLHNSQLLSQ